ncbi:MAG: hypothetical protein J0L53_07285 [Spirochaetes bacterium]|nr:hypothetical protein [Spirochaetota bacterium]
MRRVEANPDNLTFGEFEDFEFHTHSKNDSFPVPQKKRLYGDFRIIRAHEKTPELTVLYREITSIEVLCENSAKSSVEKPEKRFAVSFEAGFELLGRDGKTIVPRGGADRTRISYWNFGADDFYALNFLRHNADKLLFIAGCELPATLLRIAAKQIRDEAIASAAYRRAQALLSGTSIQGEAMAAWREYLAALFRAGKKTEMQKAIADYRRSDREGAEGNGLAGLLHEFSEPSALVEEVVKETVARLTRYKPKHYSLALEKILDFMTAENLVFLKPDALLWQAYLAASAERELAVLRRLYVRALRMNADKETLQLIHNTWRGFMGPRAPRIGEKSVRQISQQP